MNKLSDIFEEHKNNIVAFIDDVGKSAYKQGRADERKELIFFNDCESCSIHHVDNMQEVYQQGRADQLKETQKQFDYMYADKIEQVKADTIDECLSALKEVYDGDSWCVEILEKLKEQKK